MPHDLPKAYDPAAIEDKWAEYWVRENLFTQPPPTAEQTESKGTEGNGPDGQSSPESESGAEPFTILLPPPNVTGRLHMGHMLNQTEMDILTRWHRMRGDKTLWVPGTDHAGIATQMMVERQLASEGTSRQSLGREAFEARVWQWRHQYGKAILDQMKRLGASVDWQREYFTMDAGLSVAVREAFTRLYAQGLIYRGAYVVNWCPSCQTAISDLEVVHEEELGKLWEIRYPVAGSPNEFLTIATTRPETLLGDVAVAIHPEDERYLHLHGKSLLLPLMNREIPIVLDSWVSRDFGTGAVKITPAHDPNDFALGQRHHLPSINIMDATAKINEAGGVYAGLDRYVARKRVLEDLEALGLLGAIHDHKLSVGRCDRSKDVVEPRLSTQWFLKIEPLAKRAIEVVEKGYVKFTPEQYKKTYLNWMENIHDWCISRQLWWGHRIPAWHCASCHKLTVPIPGQAQDPTACEHCGGEIAQETDVLDTWFSSGLLPVSVFGWPFADGKPSADFSTFYPTSLLVTGFDILFFWVARMIMLGCWFAADVPMPDGSQRSLADSVPFRDVYIHALVRDSNREKMSKTKGNVIDPIEIVEKYGTDAVRFTLASMASPGTDIAFNVARTEGYRAFANKIWNAARFLFMNIDRAAEIGITVDSAALGGMPSLNATTPAQTLSTSISSTSTTLTSATSASQGLVKGHDFSRADNADENVGALAPEGDAPLEARWIVDAFQQTASRVNSSLATYRYDDAASEIYKFFWGSFCDVYVESVKLRLDFTENANRSETQAALNTLVAVFEASLRLLSPFMPFITEELWETLYDGAAPHASIALSLYPSIELDWHKIRNRGSQDPGGQMIGLQNLKTEVLSYRKELGVEEKELTPIVLRCGSFLRSVIDGNRALFRKLAKVSEIQYEQNTGSIHPELARRAGPDFDFAVIYDKPIDVAAERDRLTKEIAKLEKALASAERQLGNDAFTSKAPAHIVEGLKKQEAENRLLLAKAQAASAALPDA